MKKLLLLLTLFSTTTFAQNISKPGEPYDYYCEVARDGEYGRIKIGYDLSHYYNFLTDSTKEKITFTTDAELLTFMSKRGWKYVSKFIGENIKKNVYILSKQVIKDREAEYSVEYTSEKSSHLLVTNDW